MPASRDGPAAMPWQAWASAVARCSPCVGRARPTRCHAGSCRCVCPSVPSGKSMCDIPPPGLRPREPPEPRAVTVSLRAASMWPRVLFSLLLPAPGSVAETESNWWFYHHASDSWVWFWEQAWWTWQDGYRLPRGGEVSEAWVTEDGREWYGGPNPARWASRARRRREARQRARLLPAAPRPAAARVARRPTWHDASSEKCQRMSAA